MKRRMNPNSLKNLKPNWSRENHPKSPGPPKKQDCLVACIRDLLPKVSATDLEGRTHEQIIADALIQAAERGNMQAIEIILERTAGRVPLPVQGDFKVDTKVIFEIGRGYAK